MGSGHCSGVDSGRTGGVEGWRTNIRSRTGVLGNVSVIKKPIVSIGSRQGLGTKIVARIKLTCDQDVVLTVNGDTIQGKVASTAYFFVPEPVTIGSGILRHKTAHRVRCPSSTTEIDRISPLP